MSAESKGYIARFENFLTLFTDKLSSSELESMKLRESLKSQFVETLTDKLHGFNKEVDIPSILSTVGSQDISTDQIHLNLIGAFGEEVFAEAIFMSVRESVKMIRQNVEATCSAEFLKSFDALVVDLEL